MLVLVAQTIRMNTPQRCPCDTALPYAQCCEPLHAGLPAPDARALMRSRYSAYVLGLEDYLLASWHASTRPAGLGLASAKQPKWLRLKVLEFVVRSDNHAEVEFEARFIEGGRHGCMRERSRFVREARHWFYVDGDVQ